MNYAADIKITYKNNKGQFTFQYEYLKSSNTI